MVTLESFHNFTHLSFWSLSLFIGLLAMALVAKRELACFFLMMMIMAFSGACMAATYIVGDSAGWTIQIPVDYTKWSSTNNFHVGDKIGELPLFLSRLFVLLFSSSEFWYILILFSFFHSSMWKLVWVWYVQNHVLKFANTFGS